jgi:UDP-2-acetamido-3-amino-2,3-dideoxy-glucuronate N-acetyltransferase
MTMIDPSAEVAPSAKVGDGTRIWGLAQVREDAELGSECVVGRGAYVGTGVIVGDRVKIQNLAQVYEPARLADGVFIGPAAVLTNDQFPRSVTPSGDLATGADWTPVGVHVLEGASIGARAVCVAPVRIGRWSMVGAGATVVDDVPDHALVVGSPARRIGWVGRAGRRLVEQADGSWQCPVTGALHVVVAGTMSEVGR